MATGISQAEKWVYGHDYPAQTPSKRLTRLEKTLFGSKQPGSIKSRFPQLYHFIEKQQRQKKLDSHKPMIAYLENKLFLQTFPSQPLDSRLIRLEKEVFGHTFLNYPTHLRVKKLTYAIPLVSQSMSIDTEDTKNLIIANTEHLSLTQSKSQKVETDLLKGDMPTITQSMLPNNEQLSHGNYLNNLYQPTPGKWLRWTNLPVKVHIQRDTLDKSSEKALALWGNHIPLQQVSTISEADIILGWQPSSHQRNNTTVITKPVLYNVSASNSKTMILINLYPIRFETAEKQLHIIAHQVGHALGLWGHSKNTADLMYPLLSLETKDFPEHLQHQKMPFATLTDPVSPTVWKNKVSERDINTLVKLYQKNSLPLDDYNPDSNTIR